MKKLLLVCAAAWALATPPAAVAQVTGNFGFVSDYRFRGLSQTFKLPALQGGFDWAHSSGVYLGTWASNVSGNSYNNGAGMEWDFYGGYKLTAGPLGLDFGALYYWYPGAYYSGFLPGKPKYNNTELYAAATWKWLTVKYNHTTSNLFGINGQTYGGSCGLNSDGTAIAGCTDPLPNANSKGSGYLDVSANYEIRKGFNLIAHYGRQKVRHFNQLDYSDWKLGVTYDYAGFTWGAAYIDTNAKERFYRTVPASGNTGDNEYLGDGTVVLSVSKTF